MSNYQNNCKKSKKLCFKIFYLLLSFITMTTCNPTPEYDYDRLGNIVGKVTDATTGEMLQGVIVTIIPGGFAKTTGSDGYFEFQNLEPKQYEIQAHKSGYVTNTKYITVLKGHDAFGDIQLTPGVQNGKLELSVSSLNFGSQNSSLSFSILNKGNESFNWNISGLDKAYWLSVNPTSGALAAGESNAVTVTLNRDLIEENKEASIIINSDDGSVALKINVEVESKVSKIQLSTNTLDFGKEYSSLTFDVKNVGNSGDINWNITGIDVDWIKVSPTTGTTAIGKSSAVKVDLDRSKMTEGKYTTTILINADKESLCVTINAENEDNNSNDDEVANVMDYLIGKWYLYAYDGFICDWGEYWDISRDKIRWNRRIGGYNTTYTYTLKGNIIKMKCIYASDGNIYLWDESTAAYDISNGVLSVIVDDGLTRIFYKM